MTKPKIADLQTCLGAYDSAGAASWCATMRSYLFSEDPSLTNDEVVSLVDTLRKSRRFELLQQVCDVLLLAGYESPRTRRFYAQALVENGRYAAALAVLDALADQPGEAGDQEYEWSEALALRGRVYKQLFVLSAQSGHPSVSFLEKSIAQYDRVYRHNPGQYLFQGINVVALKSRADKEGFGLNGIADYRELAQALLDQVDARIATSNYDEWDFAVAGEACVALGRAQDALRWLGGYVRMATCTAFHVGSTLRQLEEIWELDADDPVGKLLLPFLRASMLDKEGGVVEISPERLRAELSAEPDTRAELERLKQPVPQSDGIHPEMVFGTDSFESYTWYMDGARRCLLVGRIGRGGNSGCGTGFLLPGTVLDDRLGNDWYLLTNAHVVNKTGASNALMPFEVVVQFEALDQTQKFKGLKLVWSSPETELDTTILRFTDQDQQRLTSLLAAHGVEAYPLAGGLPPADRKPPEKLYVIGYPGGGMLQLSFRDNELLDHQEPKVHYRTPTTGGSSGSPVFDRNWQLIAIHHGGGVAVRCLNDKPGTYAANEGIYLPAIRSALGREKTL